MHVYLVSGMHPTIPAAGGVRPYVLGLAKGLQKQGFQVSLVGAGPATDAGPVEFLSVSRRYPLSNYEFIKSVWMWLRRHSLDAGSIVHAQRPDDLYPFVKRSPGSLLVCTLHGDPARGVSSRRAFGRYLYAFAERQALQAARLIISVSKSGLQGYIERFPWLKEKCRLVPVGIDLGLFKPRDRQLSRKALGLPETMTLLYAGRLEPEKRVEVLLSAVHGMANPPYVVIAGDGTLGPSLRKTGAAMSVRFLGARKTEEMPEIYSAADALILPSEFEGMPTVALEALACGTPIIATEVGDLRSIIASGDTGYFFDGTSEGLRSALETHCPALEALRPNCAKAGTQYGWDPVIACVARLYREIAR